MRITRQSHSNKNSLSNHHRFDQSTNQKIFSFVPSFSLWIDVSLSLSYLSVRASHTPTSSFSDFIRSDRARVYQACNVYEYTLSVYLGLRTKIDSISSHRVNVHSIFIVAPFFFLSFFFFLSVRTSAIWTRNCYFFPPPPFLLASLPLIIFLPSSGAITFLHLLLVQHTSSREFSIPLTIMFTRVMMDNSHAGSLLRCLSSSFLCSFTLIDRYLSSYSPVSLLF